MASDPGPLLGTGRTADVFDIGAGRVLRRYRDGRSATLEAEVMAHVARFGFPVPEVFDAVGPDLEMQQVVGPTMLHAMASRPASLFRYATQLASLHDQLHAIAPLDSMRRPFGQGDSVLHLDLHPDNVMLTDDGPVVIDFAAAAAGPAAADFAQTWVIVATSDAPGGWVNQLLVRAGRRLFVGAFLRAAHADGVTAVLADVAAARVENPNVLAHEAARVRRLAAAHAAT